MVSILGLVICDDDRFVLDLSVGIARQCIKENEYSAAILCATVDYREALRFIEKNPGIYLYFLDIDFGKSSLNGVDVAKIIKKTEPLSKIVFVTSHTDLGIRVLKSGVEPFGFIEKTPDQDPMRIGYKKYIRLAIESVALPLPTDGKQTIDGIQGKEGYLQLPVGIDDCVSLPVSQILYVEADKSVSHFLCYHTVDGSTISVRDTIEHALSSLGSGFIKSHRSVVVNTKLVVSVANGLVRFAGGETAACSFRLKGEIMRQCGVKRV
ncbi:MAG: response regulator transcription factor [Clostridiales bacterium]|nr:response regulator transcription factor [Clostridiales bacterium]